MISRRTISRALIARSLKIRAATLAVAMLGLSIVGSSAAGAATAPPPDPVLERGQPGTQVLDEHPEQVPEIAERNGLTVSKTEDILSDETSRVSKTGGIYFIEPVPAAAAPFQPEPGPFPYGQTFTLHSKPGSSRTIYLDFNGHTISGTDWPADNGGAYTALPYDTDGLASFSNAEMDAVQYIWQRVAEDYAPFDVDVTTEDPGEAKIDRSSSADTVYGTRVVVTNSPASDVTTVSTTGVAFLGAFDQTGAFTHAQRQPAWAFPAGLSFNAKYVAEVIAHEAGHTVGLSHDGQGDGQGPNAYYAGHGVWAPIMGSGYYRPVVQWSKGEYTNANNPEDDIAVMASHGALARVDDHTNNLDTATRLVSTGAGTITPAVGGVLDADLFVYTATTTGNVTFNAVPAVNGPNLDIVLTLYSGVPTQLAQNNPAAATLNEATATGLDASITFSVNSGLTYYLQVAPSSFLTPTTGYSTYGSLGQYTVSASVPGVTACASTDAIEPNDTVATASVATSGVAIASKICSGNDDHFAIEAVAGQPVGAFLQFTHAQGDLDMQLIDPSGTAVASSTGTIDNETITHTALLTGLYTLRIYGYQGAANTYNVTLTSVTCPPDDAQEPNDSFDSPRAVTPGVPVRGIICAFDNDYYSIPVQSGDAIDVDLRFFHRFGDIDVTLFDAAQTEVDSSDSTDDDEAMHDVAATAGTYRVRVYGFLNNPGNTYRLTVTTVASLPVIVPGSASIVEGNSGTKVIQVPVSLSAPSGQTVTASWSTLDNSATAPADYVTASGTVTFTPGQTTKTVAVTIKGDTLDENDELALVSFTNPANATIGGVYGLGFATITDDDPLPVIVPGSASIVEGNSGTKVIQVPVSLSAPSGRTVTASWSTLGNTATAPADYVAAAGSVTFAPGQTTKTVAVTIKGDTLDENDELALVSFTNPANATIGGVYGLGFATITDDDPLPVIVPGSASIVEGNSGTKVIQVPVSLSAPSGRTVTASWATLGNTATAPADYVAAAGSVTFAPGETTKTVAVTIKGDTLDENDELALVSFTNPTNATIGGIYGLAFATIIDDD